MKKKKDNYLISDKNDTNNNNSNNNSEINICFKEIPILNNIEMNILYNVAGYIINSIQKNVTLCKECIRSICNTKGETLEYDKFVRIRCFKKNTLFFVNRATFNIFLKMEYIFRHQKQTNANYDIRTQLEKLFISNIKCDFIPNCHNLKMKIFRRYALFRSKISCKKTKDLKKRSFNSKSMAMHNI